MAQQHNETIWQNTIFTFGVVLFAFSAIMLIIAEYDLYNGIYTQTYDIQQMYSLIDFFTILVIISILLMSYSLIRTHIILKKGGKR